MDRAPSNPTPTPGPLPPGSAFDWSSFAPERIAVMSDLHVEFADFALAADLGADMLLLAGDIHTKGRAGAWAAKLGIPCAMVLGNHDYYGDRLGRAPSRCAEGAAGAPVAVLDDSELVLANMRVLGATLWTDYKLDGNAPLAMAAAEAALRDRYARGMSDHRSISTPAHSRARAAHFATAHSRSARFLRAALAEPTKLPTLVMTHHAPSRKSLGAPAPMDPCYASDLENLMGASRVQAWVHGHSHCAMDYAVAGTRVLCNPKGYPGEETGFDPRKTILASGLAAALAGAAPLDDSGALPGQRPCPAGAPRRP